MIRFGATDSAQADLLVARISHHLQIGLMPRSSTRTSKRPTSRTARVQSKSQQMLPDPRWNPVRREKKQQPAQGIDAAHGRCRCSENCRPNGWQQMQATENQTDRAEKEDTYLPVCRRPSEPAERANDRIDQQSVKDVRAKERNPGAIQPEEAYTQPCQANIDESPGKVCSEKHELPVLCYNDETHRPSDDAERHPKTNPAKDFHSLSKLIAIE